MSTVKDVLVKARASIIATEVDENGKENQGQGRVVIDMPRFIVDEVEWRNRLADAISVLQDGYQISATVPHKAVSNPASSIAATTAELNGLVTTNNISTTCGFQYGITKELDDTDAADESPAQAVANTAITFGLTGLTALTKYYYRAYATVGTVTVYGRVLSFTTIAAV